MTSDAPEGLTIEEIVDLARLLSKGIPTLLPAMSVIETAALVGALKAIWMEEVPK